MSREYLQQIAYYSIIVLILYTLPQLLYIIKTKKYYEISNITLLLNTFIFGIFTLYANSFKDYLLSSLYALMFISNFYMLYLKNYTI